VRVHLVDEHAVDVAREQGVPLATPDHLDHVPAGAAEVRLQLLDDLAVAADRAVELLQVAVDDEREVVELLAGGQADGAERLGLAHLAVPEERPDVLLAGVLDATVLQVAVEPCLVDRVEAVRPIDTVGNSQKSGISRGWGYDDSPRPGRAAPPGGTAAAARRSAALEVRAGVDTGEAWPWMNSWSPPPGWSLPRKKWL
jgi:hypothetical protein